MRAFESACRSRCWARSGSTDGRTGSRSTGHVLEWFAAGTCQLNVDGRPRIARTSGGCPAQPPGAGLTTPRRDSRPRFPPARVRGGERCWPATRITAGRTSPCRSNGTRSRRGSRRIRKHRHDANGAGRQNHCRNAVPPPPDFARVSRGRGRSDTNRRRCLL
jgi:hypothetical protein